MADQQRNLEDLKTAFFKKLKDIEESHRIQVTTLKNEFRQEFDRLQSSSSSSSSSGPSRRQPQRSKGPASREADDARIEKPRVPRTQQKKEQASEQSRDSSRDNRRPQRSAPASAPAPSPSPAKAPREAPKAAPKAAPAPAKEPAPLTPKSVLARIFNSKGGVTEAQVEFLKNHLLQIGSNDEELTAFVDLFHSFASRTAHRRRKGAVFADLCGTLHKEVAHNKIRFRAKLLQKCQSEFEAPIPAIPFNEETKEEDGKKQAREKFRKMGNAGLIGYLVRNGLLKDTLIFNDCILPMLKAEDLDINRLACCCRVIRILGSNLDSTKGKDFLDPIFASLQSLSSSPSLSSSSSLAHLLALRAANWVSPPSEESSSSSSSSSSSAPVEEGKQEKAPAPRRNKERKPRAQVDDGDQSQSKEGDLKKEPASDEKAGDASPSEKKKRNRGKGKPKGTINVSILAEPSTSAPAAPEEKKDSDEKPAE